MPVDQRRPKLLRAVGYVRVSTKRQADHEISLLEQEKRIRKFCDANGIELVDLYIERGASARSDRRPMFQQMIDQAAEQPKPFDVVLIYNFSRFFRDEFEFESYRRKLASLDVDVVSITQAIGEGPAGKLTRKVTTLLDGYHSEINAIQTQDAMVGNADAGYWNGSSPPFGYQTYRGQAG